MTVRWWVIALALVAGLGISFWLAVTDDSPRYELGRGLFVPESVPEPNAYAAPVTTSTSEATTTSVVRKVRAARAPTPAPASLIHGLLCGGDLPPCWVLARESMTAEDPVTVWNGHCYYEPGYAGDNPCGSTASGKWQVIRSTWRGFGGFLNAADAPVDVQDAFARQLWAGGAGCSHWAAC